MILFMSPCRKAASLSVVAAHLTRSRERNRPHSGGPLLAPALPGTIVHAAQRNAAIGGTAAVCDS